MSTHKGPCETTWNESISQPIQTDTDNVAAQKLNIYECCSHGMLDGNTFLYNS